LESRPDLACIAARAMISFVPPKEVDQLAYAAVKSWYVKMDPLRPSGYYPMDGPVTTV